MASVQQCSTCKYAYGTETELSLTCRRYPPTALVEEIHENDGNGRMLTRQFITSRYVEVNDTDWCGEYVPK